MKQSLEHLMEHIATLEGELHEKTVEARYAKTEASKLKAVADKLQRQAKTMHTLNLGMFSQLEVDQIYALVCESLVYQLGWDAAFVVSIQDGKVVLNNSYQATDKQKENIVSHLPTARSFTEAYANKATISTFHSQDKDALVLRTVFQTEEAVAVPILFAQHMFGYLVVCAHHSRALSEQYADLDFLAEVGAQVGHAVQNSTTFKDLEHQNTQLRELDEVKNSFISITSHQLRTPLSIVKWILSILQSDITLQPLPEQKKMIDQAYESNERLIHVVNDLLNVSRIQEGKLPHSPQFTDLKVLLNDVASATEKLSRSQNIKLEIIIDEQLPSMELDPILFREAVQNLMSNALDYNRPEGFVRLEAKLDPKTVEIMITNSGIGIHPADSKKIFDQFYRSPEAIKHRPNGNGLGLYLTKTIIEQHGGTITCASRPGEETMFTISLPLP